MSLIIKVCSERPDDHVRKVLYLCGTLSTPAPGPVATKDHQRSVTRYFAVNNYFFNLTRYHERQIASYKEASPFHWIRFFLFFFVAAFFFHLFFTVFTTTFNQTCDGTPFPRVPLTWLGPTAPFDKVMSPWTCQAARSRTGVWAYRTNTLIVIPSCCWDNYDIMIVILLVVSYTVVGILLG